MSKRLDLTGHAFGRLTALRRVESDRWGLSRWECRCACGTVVVVALRHLRAGVQVSCGCLRLERTGKLAVTYARKHGYSSRVQKHPLYTTWQSMWHRCRNRNATAWSYYGGRGITVCARWRDFPTFLADMGERPTGTTLDRIDNDGNYEPGNVRWATKSEQQRNKRTIPKARIA